MRSTPHQAPPAPHAESSHHSCIFQFPLHGTLLHPNPSSVCARYSCPCPECLKCVVWCVVWLLAVRGASAFCCRIGTAQQQQQKFCVCAFVFLCSSVPCINLLDDILIIVCATIRACPFFAHDDDEHSHHRVAATTKRIHLSLSLHRSCCCGCGFNGIRNTKKLHRA